MANAVNNTLYVEGPAPIVDQLVRDGLVACAPEPEHENWEEGRKWRVDRWGTKWIVDLHTRDLKESDGIKTVMVTFDSAWSTPWTLLLAVIAKYHPLGLDFFLFWHDYDGGLVRDPLFGGDCVTCGTCFGEMYTKVISSINDGEKTPYYNHGQHSVLALNCDSGHCEQVYTPWFRERGYSDAQIAALTVEQVRAVARDAYPNRALVSTVFTTDEEVLTDDGVVNRRVFLNDLIARTWGEGWLQQRGIEKGGMSIGDFKPGEYDQLICDAYPEYSEAHRASVARAAQPIAVDVSDSGDDFFAKLAMSVNNEGGAR